MQSGRNSEPRGVATIYVVRVWLAPSGFCAAVRRVTDEKSLLFDDVDTLARYLATEQDRGRDVTVNQEE
jgi:hypothetical protein